MSKLIIDPNLTISRHGKYIEFPVHYMRGGTSTGIIIWEDIAPVDVALREELLRHLMGVPLDGDHPGNKQITGLGRGVPTSNKAFFVSVEACSDGRRRLVSTLAQLASDHAAIDWSVNCGNMSSALPLWAFDTGILKTNVGDPSVDIFNTNTGVQTTARLGASPSGELRFVEIPGVIGAYPQVDLFLHHPVGAKTGALLPTGAPRDSFSGISASCVDVAVPMVIIQASEFGKTGNEPISDLVADAVFMRNLRNLWTEAGLRMKLRNSRGELMSAEALSKSETIPKVCLVSSPQTNKGHISARYFTPQTGHTSMAVSGGCCLAAATLIPGSVAQEVARRPPKILNKKTEFQISIENPAGILDATITGKLSNAGLEINSAAYRRNAQILMRGKVPLYHASSSLATALTQVSFHEKAK